LIDKPAAMVADPMLVKRLRGCGEPAADPGGSSVRRRRALTARIR